MLGKRLSLASLQSRLLVRYLFVTIIIIFLDFTSRTIHLLDFQTLLPIKSNIFTMKTLAFFFAGITDLMCFIWLVDRLHFLPNFFSFLKCSLTLPLSSVELAATYTRFIKWCLRATPIRRSSLHQLRWNAERLVSLMTDVKAIMSSCSLQYVS